MMNIIAVVGKSGSGKSTLSKTLAQLLKCEIINFDKVAHNIYNNPEFIDFINEVFGSKYIDENGQIVDRKIIGEYLFTHKSSKKVALFNEVSWKLMQNEIDKQLNTIKSHYVILEWFNLHNTKYFDMANIKILVKAKDEQKRMLMVRLRDNISRDYLDKRENCGINYNVCDYDYVVENDYENTNFIDRVKLLSSAILNSNLVHHSCKAKNLEY